LKKPDFRSGFFVSIEKELYSIGIANEACLAVLRFTSGILIKTFVKVERVITAILLMQTGMEA